MTAAREIVRNHLRRTFSKKCAPSSLHGDREDWILRGPRWSSFWLLRNLSNHMDRQARTGDTVLVMSREMTGRSRVLPWWLEGEVAKTTENKIQWPRGTEWQNPGKSRNWRSCGCGQSRYFRTGYGRNWFRELSRNQVWVETAMSHKIFNLQS